MTRTDVVASSRPQAPSATPTRKRSFGAFRKGLILPVALTVAALAMPSAALAAEGTSGYNQTPSTPKTTPTATTPATTTPSTGTSPSKETTTPSTGTSPSKETTTPSSSTAPATTSSTPTAKATTLPFTGLDLRWTIAVGLFLMGAGFAIFGVQRRQRRGNGS